MTSRDMLDDMAFELGAKAGRTATKAFSHGDEILPEHATLLQDEANLLRLMMDRYYWGNVLVAYQDGWHSTYAPGRAKS